MFTSDQDGGDHQGKFCGSIGFKLAHMNGILICGHEKEIQGKSGKRCKARQWEIESFRMKLQMNIY